MLARGKSTHNGEVSDRAYGHTARERTRCARLVVTRAVIRKHNCYAVTVCCTRRRSALIQCARNFFFLVHLCQRPRRPSASFSLFQCFFPPSLAQSWAKKTRLSRVCSPKRKNNCCPTSAGTFPPNPPLCSTAALLWFPLCPSVSALLIIYLLRFSTQYGFPFLTVICSLRFQGSTGGFI